MTVDEILRKHCPARCRIVPSGATCLTCGPFRIALEDAKREGYQVAIRLIEKNPAAAKEVLVSLLTSTPPVGT